MLPLLKCSINSLSDTVKDNPFFLLRERAQIKLCASLVTKRLLVFFCVNLSLNKDLLPHEIGFPQIHS